MAKQERQSLMMRRRRPDRCRAPASRIQVAMPIRHLAKRLRIPYRAATPLKESHFDISVQKPRPRVSLRRTLSFEMLIESTRVTLYFFLPNPPAVTKRASVEYTTS